MTASQLMRPRKPQTGYATLIIILVLLFALTTLMLSSARSSKTEQLIAGNNLRSQEVENLADATLNYALAWSSQNPLPWQDSRDASIQCGADPGCPSLPLSLKANDGSEFNLTLQWQRNPNQPNFIKIIATATQASNQARSTVSCYSDLHGVMIPGTWRDF